MTRFLDGPAQGVTLFLHRAPIYLRVVQGPDGPTHTGDWDALDQLDDSPRSDERIVVYQMEGKPTWMHVNRRVNGRNASGFYRGGSYRLIDPQPADELIRSTAAWRAWVGEQVGQSIGDDGGIAP